MIVDPRGFGQAENSIFESRTVYILESSLRKEIAKCNKT